MHIIRLRGPWQLEPIERYVLLAEGRHERTAADLPSQAKMQMPADWSAAFGPDFRGRVRYRRTFQKPTGLESGQRVWLVIEPPRSAAHVVLNDELLGATRFNSPPARFNVAKLLDVHNRLEIVVEHPLLDARQTANDDSNTNSAGGLIGEVRLEIEE